MSSGQNLKQNSRRRKSIFTGLQHAVQCRRIGRAKARQNFSKWIEELPPPPPDSKLVFGQLPTHHHNHHSNGHKHLHSNPIVGGKKALARIMHHRNHKEACHPLPLLLPLHGIYLGIIDHAMLRCGSELHTLLNSLVVSNARCC